MARERLIWEFWEPMELVWESFAREMDSLMNIEKASESRMIFFET
jgi:hypothetical protein